MHTFKTAKSGLFAVVFGLFGCSEQENPPPDDGGSSGHDAASGSVGQTCGGIAALRCSTGEYCNYAPEASCGATDRSGTCATRPEICYELYKPVCGCDGKTYGNACKAAAAGIAVSHDGAC